jgi:phosphoesterase RecJ-like protein
MRGVWGTNSSVEQIAAALTDPRVASVAITTHAKPDGDAIGSTLSVARALQRVGKTVEIRVAGPVPRWAKGVLSAGAAVPLREFVPGSSGVSVDGGAIPDCDLAVVVDTGSWSQLAEMRPWLEPMTDRAVLLDHHLHGDPEVAARRVVATDCASCTQVVAPLCERLLGARAAELPLDVAEPLYLGLATDTGWYRYSSVTPAVMRLAGDLMQAGVDHTRLYTLIEQQDAPARWALLGRALNTLRLHDAGQIATMSLTDRDFVETGATRNDTGGFADMILTVASVRVSCVLVANPSPAGEPPLTKISLRSKPGPAAIDVNQAAQIVGGGGHARAAGAKTAHPLPEAEAILLSALRRVWPA